MLKQTRHIKLPCSRRIMEHPALRACTAGKLRHHSWPAGIITTALRTGPYLRPCWQFVETGNQICNQKRSGDDLPHLAEILTMTRSIWQMQSTRPINRTCNLSGNGQGKAAISSPAKLLPCFWQYRVLTPKPVANSRKDGRKRSGLAPKQEFC